MQQAHDKRFIICLLHSFAINDNANPLNPLTTLTPPYLVLPVRDQGLLDWDSDRSLEYG